MTDPQQQRPETDPAVAPPSKEQTASDSAPGEEPAVQPEVSQTVGTGTSIALGCVAGTIVLVLIGLLFLGIVVILG